MNECINKKSLLIKCICLAVFAWLLQIILLVPMMIWGMYLSEKASPFFSETFVGVTIVYGSFYFFTFIPSILIIFSGKVLAYKVSKKMRYLELLQPSLLLGLIFAFSGPGGGMTGIGMVILGFINIAVVNFLMRYAEI